MQYDALLEEEAPKLSLFVKFVPLCLGNHFQSSLHFQMVILGKNLEYAETSLK